MPIDTKPIWHLLISTAGSQQMFRTTICRKSRTCGNARSSNWVLHYSMHAGRLVRCSSGSLRTLCWLYGRTYPVKRFNWCTRCTGRLWAIEWGINGPVARTFYILDVIELEIVWIVLNKPVTSFFACLLYLFLYYANELRALVRQVCSVASLSPTLLDNATFYAPPLSYT